MTDTTATATTKISLEIGGMTCASCAARIAKRLNKLDGVQASVNYATERATLITPDGISTEDVIAEIEAIGYTARIPGPASPLAAGEDDYDDGRDDSEREVRALRHRLIGTAVLGIPVVVISMITTLQFTNWQWLAFALAAPVVFWGAWPFHRAAWMNLRHGAATMDTLIWVRLSSSDYAARGMTPSA